MLADQRRQSEMHRKRRQGWLVVFVAAAFVAPLRSSFVFGQTAAAPATARDDARARYEQGARAYNESRYEDAITHFAAAYALEPAGALLLNIAQAYRLKAPPNCEAALRHYELYLAAEPRAPERTEVLGHMDGMRQCLAEASRVAEPHDTVTSAPAVLPTPEPVTQTKTPVWFAAAGGAVFVGGAALYTVARLRFNTLEGECPCPDARIDRWQTLTNVSYVSMALGSLTAATALVWWGWDGRKNKEQAQSTVSLFTGAPSAWVTGREIGLTWQGRFR